jgi:hypothetical protein
MLPIFLLSAGCAVGAVWASLQPTQYPLASAYFAAGAVLFTAVAAAAFTSMVMESWNGLRGSWGNIPREETDRYQRSADSQRRRKGFKVVNGGRK